MLAANPALAEPALPPPAANAAYMKAALHAVCGTDPSDAAALSSRFPGATLLEARVSSFRDQPGRALHGLLLTNGGELQVQRVFPLGRLRRITLEYHEPVGEDRARPAVSLMADADCSVREVRRINYDGDGRAASLTILEGDFSTPIAEEPLNPPVPPGRDPGGVPVALIDTGVNYTLPGVAQRLARNDRGELLGGDFWDMDPLPFDTDTSRSPFFPLHHGTAVASILLREAPAARLLPYRYPRPDMTRMTALVAQADDHGARIVNMAMGSNNRQDWRALEDAARARPHMLFVVSAGNNGRDIDIAPVYPAALDLDNLLVVTSADAAGRLAEGSNWGPEHVDVMVPGERMPVIDHRGVESTASGSSFAVPRVSALAARLLAKYPDWSAAKVKSAITGRGRPSRHYAQSPVRHGWIPDPTDDFVN